MRAPLSPCLGGDDFRRERFHGTRPSVAPAHRRSFDAALADGPPCSGGEPLHRKIDRLIEAKIEGEVAASATDAEFLRRVCLDLTGMIPTSTEAPRVSRRSVSLQAAEADRPPAGRPRVRPADAGRLRRDADGTSRRHARAGAGVACVPAAGVRREHAVQPARRRDPLGRWGRPRDACGRQVLPRPPGGSQLAHARHRPDVPRPRLPVRPVPRPSADRRLQAGALLRDLRLPEPDDLVRGRQKGVGARREGGRGRHIYVGLQEEGHAQDRPAHPGWPGGRRSRACPRGPNTWSLRTRRERSARSPATAAAPSWPRADIERRSPSSAATSSTASGRS